MSNLTKEYIIDKNYIYKNLFEEIKDLLDENEKIKIVTLPRYVPIAFQVAKELNEEGIALYDEELKVERNSKEGKMKTKIYLSIKRKPIQKEQSRNYTIMGREEVRRTGPKGRRAPGRMQQLRERSRSARTGRREAGERAQGPIERSGELRIPTGRQRSRRSLRRLPRAGIR